MKKKLTLPKLGTVSDYRHLWMLSFWILYLILYVVVEHAVTTDYWVSYLPLDDKIPFCEYFIIPYCMWHPLLFLMTVYLAFYDVETFRKYMWFVLAGLVSAIVVCWIFPNGQDLRPAVMEQHNFFTWMVQYTYSLDTNTNVFPSVHVLGVMAALFAIWHTPGMKKWTWRVFSALYGALIIASTLFVKQHAFIDVVAALVVGAIAYVIIYVIIGGRRDRRMAAAGKEVPCGEHTDPCGHQPR